MREGREDLLSPRSLSELAHKGPTAAEAGPGSSCFTEKYSNSLKGLLQLECCWENK